MTRVERITLRSEMARIGIARLSALYLDVVARVVFSNGQQRIKAAVLAGMIAAALRRTRRP